MLLLLKRNLIVFFKDKTGVFFSVLSSFILILLYIFFLGRLQVESLQEIFPSATSAQVQDFVNNWVFAGIILITIITTSLGALSVFVDDASSGRFQDFLVSPISRSRMILGYIISSFVVSLLITFTIFLIGQIYMWQLGGSLFGVKQLGQTVFYIIVIALVFSALSGFVVTFIRSSAAFSALSAIVGAGVGFLSGAYLPPGILQNNVAQFLNILPFAQSAMLLRNPYTSQSVQDLVVTLPLEDQDLGRKSLEDFYGISLSVGGFGISSLFVIVVLLLLASVFMVFGALRIRKIIN